MTDNNFKELMALDKYFIRPESIKLPREQERKIYSLKSTTTEDSFIFDYDRRGRFELKYKEQLRYVKDICLVRLEVNAPQHMNPDGSITSRNHMHIYREGYGLSWAYEISEIFTEVSQKITSLYLFKIFCEYCKIDASNINLQGVL